MFRNFSLALADRSREALKKLQPELAMAQRGGRWEQIDAGELVPGDIVDSVAFSVFPCSFSIRSFCSVGRISSDHR